MHCGSMGTPFAMPLGSAKPAQCTEPLLQPHIVLQVPACHQLWKYIHLHSARLPRISRHSHRRMFPHDKCCGHVECYSKQRMNLSSESPTFLNARETLSSEGGDN